MDRTRESKNGEMKERKKENWNNEKEKISYER